MKDFFSFHCIILLLSLPVFLHSQDNPIIFVPQSYAISTASGIQASPSVLYAGSQDEFLAVWVDYRACHENCLKADIYGQMLDIDGKHIGSDFRINDSEHFYYNDEGMPPSIAYDHHQDRFLVCWDDREKVYSQLVDPSAGPGATGSNHVVTTGVPGRATSPAIIYNSRKKKYLIAWDNRDPYDIYIKGLDKEGAPVGLHKAVNSEGGGEPAWAYNSNNPGFLLAWTDGFGFDKDIYYRMVGTDGRFKSPKRPIADLAGVQNNAQATYNMYQDLFLVVWTDDRDLIQNRVEIYGQKIRGNGKMEGDNFRITYSAELEVSSMESLDFSLPGQKFLLAYTNVQGGTVNHDVLGKWLHTDGQPNPGTLPIAAETYNELTPSVSASENSPNFLVGWDDGRNAATTRNDIYGRRIKSKFKIGQPEKYLSEEVKNRIMERGKVSGKEIQEYWKQYMQERSALVESILVELEKQQIGPESAFSEKLSAFKKEMDSVLGVEVSEKILANPSLVEIVKTWAAEKKKAIIKKTAGEAGLPEEETDSILTLVP